MWKYSMEWAFTRAFTLFRTMYLRLPKPHLCFLPSHESPVEM